MSRLLKMLTDLCIYDVGGERVPLLYSTRGGGLPERRRCVAPPQFLQLLVIATLALTAGAGFLGQVY